MSYKAGGAGVVPLQESTEGSGQNQREAVTIPAKQLMLSKADINLEKWEFHSPHLPLSQRKGISVHLSTGKGLLSNKTLQRTKCLFYGLFEGRAYNSVFTRTTRAPKFLDDWMHTMICQIISFNSTLMQLLFPGDDNHRRKNFPKPWAFYKFLPLLDLEASQTKNPPLNKWRAELMNPHWLI